MSAGRGITHSEANARPDAPVHLVQMWVLPDEEGIEPTYEQRDIGDALTTGDLVPVASGQGHPGTVSIHQRDAVLSVGRLPASREVNLPDARHVHVYVARGGTTLNGTALETGDAARLTEHAAARIRAGADGAEVLVWATA
jgi:redox-sensitive bicupin YhaK (pirin superfamily)